MSTKRLRGWDSFVSEAKNAYEEKYRVKEFEFPLSDDEVYTIKYPNVREMRLLDRAMGVGDYDSAARILLGEKLADRLIELTDGDDDLHLNPLISLVREVIEEFGLANLRAMTEEDEAEAGKDSPKPSTKPAAAPRRSRSTAKKSSSTSSSSE